MLRPVQTSVVGLADARVKSADANVRPSGTSQSLCYIFLMDRKTAEVLDRIASWPEEDREELAEIAAAIEARRAGIYVLSEDERLAVEEGLRDADAGNFVSDEEMEKSWARTRSL